MIKVIAVFLGGSIGASLRYLISLSAHNYGWSYQGTFIINVIGCLFLGFVSYIAAQKKETFNPDLKLFLTTGIAGGFTTFSTFSYEIFTLIKSGHEITGIIYMVLSLFTGLIAVVSGMSLAKYAFSLQVKTDKTQVSDGFTE